MIGKLLGMTGILLDKLTFIVDLKLSRGEGECEDTERY